MIQTSRFSRSQFCKQIINQFVYGLSVRLRCFLPCVTNSAVFRNNAHAQYIYFEAGRHMHMCIYIYINANPSATHPFSARFDDFPEFKLRAAALPHRDLTGGSHHTYIFQAYPNVCEDHTLTCLDPTWFQTRPLTSWHCKFVDTVYITHSENAKKTCFLFFEISRLMFQAARFVTIRETDAKPSF